MKKYTYALLVSLLVVSLSAKIASGQTKIDTTVTLDVLTVPNSPAFNLLEISPGAVDKPTTPNDFAISFANASKNFSVIPKNYAIEFLPISFFPKSKTSYAKFTNDPKYVTNQSQKLWNTISQTFLLSGGFSTDDSVKTSTPDYIKTRAGFGFKFSLARGKIDTAFEDYKKSIDTIRLKLKILHDENDKMWEHYKKTNAGYLKFEGERNDLIQATIDISKNNALSADEKTNKINDIKKQLDTINAKKTVAEDIYKDSISKTEKTILDAAAVLKKQIEQIKFKRYGWLLDFAGGMAIGFRNDDFQNSVVQQYAFWFNGGYSCKKGFSFLGVARYSNAVDAIIDSEGSKKDKAFYDLGGKIEYQTDDNKFSLNGEIVDRISSDTPLLRYTFNASYQVGKNQALTFSVGKAFAGTTQYGGNLIAALNYIKTFGSNRSVVPSR